MPRDTTPGGHAPYAAPTAAIAGRRLDLAGMAATLLDEIAADEDERWGGGRISASAYEAAWVGLVRHPEDPQRLAFPAALGWLLRHQRRDGSWGPPFPHCVIPSMAALLALRRAPEQTDTIRKAGERGLRAVRRVLPRWRAEMSDTPFFEFLILALTAELERLGIHLDVPDRDLLLALRRAPEQTDAIRAAAGRGLRALRRVLPRWRAEMSDTPFFEFLILALTAELEGLGIHLDVPDRDLLLARREAKLAHLPIGALYTGRSSLVHALEVLDPAALDYQRLLAVRASNGAYGCSPSATAAVLLHAPRWDAAAARWLRHLDVESARAGDPGAMATSHPEDAFEAAWALHLLRLGGFAVADLAGESTRHILEWLRGALTPDGAGFSRLHGLPCDADDTALVLAVLNDAGESTNLTPLDAFARDSHYVNYEGERTASTSTNAHALDALLSMDARNRPARAAERQSIVVRYLLAEGSPDGCWEDKWHLSPYYATLSCALALAKSAQSMRNDGGGYRATRKDTGAAEAAIRARLEATLAWLARTQRSGGGWGLGTSATLEETAYGTLTATGLLRLLPRPDNAVYRRMVQTARGYLRRHLSESADLASLPTLWVDKTLYAPPRVIRAAVLAALHSSLGA